MKRIICFFLSFILLFGLTANAEGDPNIDGGGGGNTGSGTGTNKWMSGDDGVRVTVIKDSNRQPVTKPVDFSNKDTSNVEIYFVKRCKLDYRYGSELSIKTEKNYISIKPKVEIPKIVSGSGINNIAAIKRYFSLSGTLKDIAANIGMDYPTMINGDYVLLIEPIVYLTFNGVRYAMTATEAAYLDAIKSGDLKAKMGSLTHMNLPRSMYLEKPDLGFSVPEKPFPHRNTDAEIINTLGIGTVRFDKSEETPTGDTYDYEYRTNTDVITAVKIDNGSEDITPDDPGQVTFGILGKSYAKQFVCPQYGEQLVWIRWHTPDTEQVINITVSSTTGDYKTIRAKISKLPDKEPPDPKFHDKNQSFSLAKTPDWGSKNGVTWSEWWPVRVETEFSYYWVFQRRTYGASLSSKMTLKPNHRVKTAFDLGYGDWEMKSGYGVDVECETWVSTSGGAASYDVTPVQNIVAVFPEFGFKTYDRLLMPEDGKAEFRKLWKLKPNRFSYYNEPTHFTPLWYPDKTDYPVATASFDVWTPGGQLYISTSDVIKIDGNMYDDWYIRNVRFER